MGASPLAVHYDNTWNSATASQNIRKVLGGLGIDLYTHVIDNRESDDIFHAFFEAGVADLDCATDLALAEVSTARLSGSVCATSSMATPF